MKKIIRVKNSKGKTIRKVGQVNASSALVRKIQTKLPKKIPDVPEDLKESCKNRQEPIKKVSNPNLGVEMVETLSKGKPPLNKKVTPSKKLQSIVLADFALLKDEYPSIEPEKKPMEVLKREETYLRTLYPKK